MLTEKKHYRITQAKIEDLQKILKLQEACCTPKYTTPNGTNYLKKLSKKELQELVPNTLILKYQGTVQGKIHWKSVDKHPHIAVIGGFAINKIHQGKRMGGELFQKLLNTLRKKSFHKAVSITASPAVHKFFKKFGGTAYAREKWKLQLLENAKKRYGTDADQVKIFTFSIEKLQ